MGQHKASKRAAKEAARHSLKSKGTQQQENALDLLLSDELKDQLLAGGSDQQQLIVLPGSKGKKKEGASQAETGTAGSAAADNVTAPLSKSQQRKLKQIQLKKERRENISQVLEKLNSSSLTDGQLALLRPLHQRGAKETKKQRLRRALQLQRAGVPLSAEAEAELYQPRKAAAVGAAAHSEDAVSDSEDGMSQGNGQPVLAPRPVLGPTRPISQSPAKQPAATAAKQPSASSNKGSDGGHTSSSDSSDADAAKGEEEDDMTDDEATRKAALKQEVKLARQSAGAPMDDDDEDEKQQQEAAAKQAAAAAAEAAAVAAAGGATASRHRVVHITRLPRVQQARLGLPILAMEQEIVESVAANDVVVLCGETGCGKTTQVPQFLLEAGYGCTAFPERAGCIGVTQPRRVAATSTAQRVADELGSDLGATVGYQVRYDRSVGNATRVKFMTDGILLRELQEDFLLRRYSVLLVDEAHERSLNTDLLLGMLSRVVPLRRKLCMQQRASPGYDPTSPDAVHPLKLIIMSATMRTSDFVDNRKLFPAPPPIIEVPTRQYPVTIHFSRRTELHDYLGAAFRKVVRIHRELPPGGVLVFMTGQREVEHLCFKLRGHFSKAAARHKRADIGPGRHRMANGDYGGTSSHNKLSGHGNQAGKANGMVVDGVDQNQVVGQLRVGPQQDGAEQEQDLRDLYGGDRAELEGGWQGGGRQDAQNDAAADDYDEMNDSGDEDEEEVQILGGDAMTPDEIAAAEKRFEEQLRASALGASGSEQQHAAVVGQQEGDEEAGPGPVHVLPLYAMLPAAAQARVFEAVPTGHRLIVVATNVAETSLTIPGIRYVVDAGRSKQRLLETESGGMARFEVRWVSQAAGQQRAGRAGRTCPGHCYRLYSSAHFNDSMPRHTAPEIVNTALEGVVLQLKSLGVDKVQNFPFPTPPEVTALQAAEQCLTALCALDAATGALTDVGRAMSAFPIGPRHARMLLEVAAWQLRLEGAAVKAAAAAGSQPPVATTAAQTLPFAIALAAALTVESPFMQIENLGQQKTEQDGADGEGEGGDGHSQHHKDTVALQQQRLQQQRAHAAHAALRCADSDALSALRVLCAFEAAEDPAAFAASHYVHLRTLQEAADLHRQLLRILSTATNAGSTGLASNSSTSSQLFAGQLTSLVSGKEDVLLQAVQAHASKAGLNSAVQDCLRRALAVGWADCVARRVRSAEAVARQQEQHAATGKKHAVRYVSAAIANAYSGGVDAGKAAAAVAAASRAGIDEDVSGDVYLHPRSALHRAAPEYVVYMQLVRTSKRSYMSTVTTVKPEWLVYSGTPFAHWSPPLLEPTPAYKPPPVDAVLAWHDVSYGRHAWPLPRCQQPLKDAQSAAAVFAAALLDGSVLPAIKGLRPLLLSAPAVAARPEMRGVARVGELVGALARKHVASCSQLCKVWQQQPEYLQREMAAWLTAAHQQQLLRMWPMLLQQATQAVEAAAQVAALPRDSKRDSTSNAAGNRQQQGILKKRKGHHAAMAQGRDATELVPVSKKQKK